MHLRLLIALFTTIAIAVAAAPAHAVSPGDPIPGFATLDRQLVAGNTLNSITDLAQQGDGKIVASFAYFDGEGLNVARFHPDGSLDISFGSNGVFASTAAPTTGVYAIALDGVGRIVFAGTDDDSNLVVGRLTAAGALDPTFGVGGVTRFDAPGSTSGTLTEVFVAADGRIYAAGTVDVSGQSDFVGARLLANGAIDPQYGLSGSTAFGWSDDDALRGALLMSDQRLVLYGSRQGSTPATRGAEAYFMDTDGNPGNIVFNAGQGTDYDPKPIPWAYTAGTVIDGSTVRLVEHRFGVYAAPDQPYTSRMVQYRLVGTALVLDASFDGDGVGPDFDMRIRPTQLRRLADGKFAMVGDDPDQLLYTLKAARLRADGVTFDLSFGTAGVRSYVRSNPQGDLFPQLLETADGGLILAGNNRRPDFPPVTTLWMTKVAGRITRTSTSLSMTPVSTIGSDVTLLVHYSGANPEPFGTVTTSLTIPTNLAVRSAPAGCVQRAADQWSCTFDTAALLSTSFLFTLRASAAQTDVLEARTTSSDYDDDLSDNVASAQHRASPRGITASFKQLVRTKRGKLATSNCGATAKRACVAPRVRRNVRLAAFQLRAAVAPVAERVPAKASVTAQRLVKGKWLAVRMAATTARVTIGKGNLGTWTLPGALRTKPAYLRVRVNVAASATTGPASSAWRYIRIR